MIRGTFKNASTWLHSTAKVPRGEESEQSIHLEFLDRIRFGKCETGSRNSMRIILTVTRTHNTHMDELLLLPKVEKLHGATPSSLYASRVFAFCICRNWWWIEVRVNSSGRNPVVG